MRIENWECDRCGEIFADKECEFKEEIDKSEFWGSVMTERYKIKLCPTCYSEDIRPYYGEA